MICLKANKTHVTILPYLVWAVACIINISAGVVQPQSIPDSLKIPKYTLHGGNSSS
uniref:Uncharacterized protein n=1 Tax=Cyprinus carpio TaxID=7962 RepID=A0A8C1NM48_CYPCA